MTTPNVHLTKLTNLNNLSKLIHNNIVAQAYQEDTDAAQKLKESLSIEDSDTSVMIIQKMLLFYLGCDKLSTEVEEHTLVNKAIEAKDEHRVILQVKIRAAARFKDGKKTGYRAFRIPDVNLKYLDEHPKFFSEMHFKMGTTAALYTLKDGHQLKIYAETLEEAHKICNYCLKAVEPSKRYGSSEEHSKPVHPPKDAKKSPLHGTTMIVYKVVVLDSATGKPIGGRRIY